MTIRLEIRKTHNYGQCEVMVVEREGKEHVLETPCDENGDDLDLIWDAKTRTTHVEDNDGDTVIPYGYKLAETTYKGREDGTVIAEIQELAEHPEATYQRYVDEDDDTVWRIFFKRPVD